MKLVSVNVSRGATVAWKGRNVQTGIFKKPVSGAVHVRRLNLDGDQQSDLSVHGGEYKAVYAYALQHYAWWQEELGRDLPYGAFGENLTIAEFPEEEVCVGDVIKIGAVELEAVQPRFPCYKLGLRFNDAGMVARFLDSERWGVYFRVLKEGPVAAGDPVEWLYRDPARVPVPELIKLLRAPVSTAASLRRALSATALTPDWRDKLTDNLRKSEERQ